MRRKETLLARGRHADKQAISSAVLDAVDDFGLLARRKIAVLHPGEFKSWMVFANTRGRLFQCCGRRAEKIWLETVLLTDRQEFVQQIHARDTTVDRQTNTSRAPDNSHSVNADDIAVGHIRRKNRISPHVDEFCDIESNMLQPFPASHGFARQLDCLGHCQDIDGASQKAFAHLHPDKNE